MEKGQVLSDLPADVLLNIVSFLLGEPDYLKLKYSNALKKIQKKYLSRIYGKPSIDYVLGGLPYWKYYIHPPNNTTERKAITYFLKSQVKTIKSLLDKPYYYEDSGVKIEVEFKDGAGYCIRQRTIKGEDMIDKALTSICNSYLKNSFNLDSRGRYFFNITVRVNWKGRDLSNIPQ